MPHQPHRRWPRTADSRTSPLRGRPCARSSSRPRGGPGSSGSVPPAHCRNAACGRPDKEMTPMKTSCIRSLHRIALAGLLVLAAAPLAAARPQQEKAESTPQPTPVQTIRYEIRYMDLHAAEQLAWDQCAQKNRCRIAGASQVGGLVKGIRDVGADPETQQKVSRALAREDAAPRTQSFQLLLLAASARTGCSAAEVPANAQKALADLRGFLPFKSYQLLDSSWLRATQDNVTEARVVG